MILNVITLAIALAALFDLVKAPREVRQHDERIRNRDTDLATWVEDDDRELEIEFRRITNTLAAQDQLYSGAIPNGRQHAKDNVRQRYRDQLEDARRMVRDVAASEGITHSAYRWLTGRTLPALEAPERVAPIVAKWDEPEPGFERG